jgi:hypothetical protein
MLVLAGRVPKRRPLSLDETFLHVGSSVAFVFDMPTTPLQMDTANVALSEGLDSTMPRTYAALSEFSKVPASTLWHRTHRRRSRQEKANGNSNLN